MILVSLTVASCQTSPREITDFWYPTIYSGSSEAKAVVRSQENEIIACQDVRFDEMFCVFDRDMKMLLDKCLSEREKEKSILDVPGVSE